MHNMNTPPPPAPPAPPVPPTPPVPPDHGSAHKYEDGGMVSINWIEIGLLVLGVYGLYNVIWFYREKAKREQQNQATVKELKEKQQSLETKFYSFVNQLRRRV